MHPSIQLIYGKFSGTSHGVFKRFSALFRLSLVPLVSFTGLVGCATGSGFKAAKPGPIRLELKSKAGQEDLTRYYSHSRIHEFEGDQMTRERDEIVDFKVKEVVSKVDPSGRIWIKTSTVAKDGAVDLRDLAFPERGEEIEYVLNRQGQVLKAGEYPADSVFFVPPVPLPKGMVQVGDTWTMDHVWVGMKNGIPLGVHLVAILKNVYVCPTGSCADVEVTGQVDMIGVATGKAQFNSTLWGRLLISVEKGAVVWSEMRSKERMLLPGARTEVLSCMGARLEAGKEWAKFSKLDASCKPDESVVNL